MKQLGLINTKVSLFLLAFSLMLIFSFIAIEQLFLGNQAAAVSMQNAIGKTKEREKVFSAFLQRASLLLCTLRTSHAFEHYHNDPGDTGAGKELRDTILTLGKVNPMIMQIRYIDAKGMERLRLERTAEGIEPIFILPGALQNKSGRYYFRDAQEALPEKVTFSAIDLEVEHGRIVLPYRPTLRALLPLERQGQFDGVLVVNYFMESFLHRFLNAPLYDMILADGNGHILVHPDGEKEWGMHKQPPVMLADDFPSFAKQILANSLLVTDQFVSRKLDLPLRNGLVLIAQMQRHYAIDTRSEKLRLYALVVILVLLLGGGMSLLLSRTIGNLYADINERLRQKNSELERSQSKFFTIFQESLDPILLVDPKSFTIVEFNQRAVEDYGYTKAEFAALSFKQLHAHYDKERVGPQIDELIRNGSNRFVVTHKTKKGGIKTVSVNATAIELDDTTYLYTTLHDITRQKAHENELHRLIQQQEALMQIRTTGFAHLKTDTFLWTNDTLAALLGYTKNELNTQPAQRMFYDKQTYEHFREKSRQALQHTGVYEGEIRAKTKEGKPLHLLVGLTALDQSRDEALLVVNDITTEKQQQNLIKSQKEELEAIFHLSKDGIAIMDLQTRFIDTNLAFLELLGYSRTEMLKRSCLELTASGDHERSLEMLELLKSRGHVKSFSKNCIAKDGSILYVSFSAIVMPNRTSVLLTARDLTEMKRHEEKLVISAHYDALTGLPNRTLKADRLKQAILHVQRYGGCLAVLFFDLDGFKEVNDTHGHHIGDKVLIEIAGRLKGVLREEDTLSRLGGDEFVGIVVGLGSREELTPVLDRLLSTIETPMHIDGTALYVTVSIGVAFYCGEDKHIDGDQLQRFADQAMYAAKESGKNRYHLFGARASAE